MVLIGGDTTAPFGLDWDSGPEVNGTHTLTARAYDTLNNVASSAQVTVLVDNTAPVTALVSPAPSARLRGTVSVSATASDNQQVSKVEFYAGGTLIGTDTTAPYEVIWDTGAGPGGNVPLTTKAHDAAGNVTTSAPISVKVN